MTQTTARRFAVVATLLIVQACAVAPLFTPVPVENVDAALVAGWANMREVPYTAPTN